MDEKEKHVCVKLIQRLDAKVPVSFEGLDSNYISEVLSDLHDDWFLEKYGYDGTGTDGEIYEMFWFPAEMTAGMELINKMYEACDEPIFVNCRFELNCYYI
jgi:hypothetical protein